MNRILLIALFIVFITGCQNTKREGKSIVTFNLRTLPNLTEVKLSELGFGEIEYIPLETTDQSLIQRTFETFSLRDKLLAGDRYFIIKQFNTILKFAEDGTFISKIGTAGRGPNEFQVCHDLESDANDRVYIIDGFNKKILVYSEKGNFIKAIDIPLSGVIDFNIFNNNFVCYCENFLGDIKSSFTVLDTSGQIIKSYPNKYFIDKNSNNAYGFSHEILFYHYKDELYMKEVYSDTIYALDNLDFNPHMVIDVGNKLITPQERSNLSSIELAKGFLDPIKLFEFSDYVYYEFMSNNKMYGFIGSKKNDFTALFDSGKGIINDLDGGPNITPITVKDDNTLVGWIEANKLKNHVNSESFKNAIPKYPKKKNDLIRLSKSIMETDNPILVLAKK